MILLVDDDVFVEAEEVCGELAVGAMQVVVQLGEAANLSSTRCNVANPVTTLSSRRGLDVDPKVVVKLVIQPHGVRFFTTSSFVCNPF